MPPDPAPPPPPAPFLMQYQPTAGDALQNPLSMLTGLRADGQRDPQLNIDDAFLFARFDGTTNLAPRRPDFDAVTAQQFIRWHAAHQLEYLHLNGTTFDADDVERDIASGSFSTVPVSSKAASLGANSDGFFNLHAILSSDGKRVIILNTLSQSDIAALPLVDQRAIAALPAFRTFFADGLGLMPDSTNATIESARAQMLAMVDEAADVIRQSPAFVDGHAADYLDDPQARYHYLFLRQLDIVKDQLWNMAVFNRDSINREVNAIVQRFARLERFMTATQGELLGTTGFRQGANSSDMLSSIASARQVLTGIELRLHDLALSARDLALTGVFNERRVDTPEMVFLFQTFQNYSNEADAEARSEDLRQIQRLLQDYTMFQRMLNATLRTFDPVALADPDTIERKPLVNENGAGVLGFSQQERDILAMFDAGLVRRVADNSFHPMESRIALSRPLEHLVQITGNDFLGYFGTPIEHPKTIWDALARNIADATRFLNQDTQILMDEISGLNRQKNRNYDLATNTLNKMTDILRSIVN